MSSPYGLEFAESCLSCNLKSHNFFCHLPSSSLAAFEKIKCAYLLPRGSSLFVTGQRPSGAYFVCIGQVKLWTRDAVGRVLILKIAVPGDVLGLGACVTGGVHELTAETVQPCQVVFVKMGDLLSLVQKDRHVCWSAAQVLSRDCHEAHQLARSFGPGHSGEKLARFMLELAAALPATRNQMRVAMPLSHEELAQVIGMSRETVWRRLCDFRERGLAVLEGSTLLIQNHTALKRLAGYP